MSAVSKFAFISHASPDLSGINAFGGLRDYVAPVPDVTPILPNWQTGPGGSTWTPEYYGYYTPANAAAMTVGDQYTTAPVTVVGPPGSINSTYSGDGHQVTISAAPPAEDPAAHDPTSTSITVQGKWGSVNVTHSTTIAGQQSEISSVWSGITSFFGYIGNAIVTAWNSAVSAVESGIDWLGNMFENLFQPEHTDTITAGIDHSANSIGHDPFAYGSLHFH